MTERSFRDALYYADQTGWQPVDFYALYRYLHRLIQYVGPTPAQAARPELLTSRIQAKRNGQRDVELAALDLERMSHETRYLLKHLLIPMQRYDLAVSRFPNLGGLADVPDLDDDLCLSEDPTDAYEHLRQVGIRL